MWHTYFSNLFKISDRHSERLKTIHDKIKELENSTNFQSFCKLDFKISLNELQKSLSNLKPSKSPGLDNTNNEMLKFAQIYMNPCILKLFNKVFTSGIYSP